MSTQSGAAVATNMQRVSKALTAAIGQATGHVGHNRDPAVARFVDQHMRMPVRVEVAQQGTAAERVEQEVL
mgnify:CR=1 FL=1